MAIEAYTRSAAGAPLGLFGTAVSLEIPPFQRAYVWGHNKHWVPFWDDVAKLADDVLEATNDGSKPLAEGEGPTHFLGAVVLHRQSGQVGAIPVYRVIDGQQRLTTWQLLLHAAKEVYDERGLDDAGLLEDLVYNDPKKTKGQPQQELKIVPTRANRDEFLRAMRGKRLARGEEDSLIASAHDYFREQIAEWLKSDDENVASRAGALYTALAHLLQIVVIELDHNADPQIIFETLNARGEPLLQSDLVKNYIIHIAERQDHLAETVANEWLARYDDAWWKTEVRQGRLYRQRVEQFLNYWLVMRKAAEVRTGDVFRTFQKHVEDSGSTIHATVTLMNTSSDHYRHIVDAPSTSPIADQLRQLKILEVGVATPVILWLMANVPHGESGVAERAVRALTSYYVRRVLCGHTPTGHNRIMHELVHQLDKVDGVPADQVVINHLRGQTSKRYVWPSNSQVMATFRERRIYSMARPKLTMALEALARHIATSKDEAFDYSVLTVEHIMPQKWQSEKWAPPASGFTEAGETPTAARDRLIHTIGNLTLVTGPLNAALSNDPWSEKRAQIEEHSNLPINRDLVKKAGDVWDEQAILDRGQRLAEIAIRVWPGPGQI